MRVRNLHTGQIMNAGPDFLKQQGKPFIANDGTVYSNGVWVEHQETPLSEEASKLVANAATGTGPLKVEVPVIKEEAPIDVATLETPPVEENPPLVEETPPGVEVQETKVNPE